MPAESNAPSLRLTYRLFLPCRRESLLYNCIDGRRIRHVVLSDSVLISLREKAKHPILEILLRGSQRSRTVRLRCQGRW